MRFDRVLLRGDRKRLARDAQSTQKPLAPLNESNAVLNTYNTIRVYMYITNMSIGVSGPHDDERERPVLPARGAVQQLVHARVRGSSRVVSAEDGLRARAKNVVDLLAILPYFVFYSRVLFILHNLHFSLRNLNNPYRTSIYRPLCAQVILVVQFTTHDCDISRSPRLAFLRVIRIVQIFKVQITLDLHFVFLLLELGK